MIEILSLSLDEIKKSNVVNKLNFGVVMTGGGSQLNNIIDLSQEIFNMPVKIGYPELIDNEVSQYKNNPRYATAIGIIQYASIDNIDDFNNNNEIGIIDKIKRTFKKITNWY